MTKDIFRVLKKCLKKQSQSIDFDPTLTFCKIREEKGEIILQKLDF